MARKRTPDTRRIEEEIFTYLKNNNFVALTYIVRNLNSTPYFVKTVFDNLVKKGILKKHKISTIYIYTLND
jgi:predicted transcriptional regulator